MATDVRITSKAFHFWNKPECQHAASLYCTVLGISYIANSISNPNRAHVPRATGGILINPLIKRSIISYIVTSKAANGKI